MIENIEKLDHINKIIEKEVDDDDSPAGKVVDIVWEWQYLDKTTKKFQEKDG